jgi:hypothetical protein
MGQGISLDYFKGTSAVWGLSTGTWDQGAKLQKYEIL